MGCGTAKQQNSKAPQKIKGTTPERAGAKFFDEYALIKKLGCGTFGEMWTARQKASGAFRGVRIISKILLERSVEELRSELKKIAKLNCSSLEKLYEFFEDERRIFIVFEALKGNNFTEFLGKRQNMILDESEVSRIMREILIGLEKGHSAGIYHRDLKMDRLVFAEIKCKTLKLIDFGLGKFINPYNKISYECLSSLYYIPPELIEERKYTAPSDIWSLGIMCYILCSGELPYCSPLPVTYKSQCDSLKKISFSIESFETQAWKEVSSTAKTFVLSMLQKKPENRLTAAALLGHPWIQEVGGVAIIYHTVTSSLVRKLEESQFQHAVISFIEYKYELDIEKARLLQLFEKIDINRTRLIPVDDMKKEICKSKIIFSEDDLSNIPERLNPEGADPFDYCKYLLAVSDLTMLAMENNLRQTLKFFDKENNNQLIKTEILSVLQECSGKQILELLSNIHEIQDEIISIDEFLGIVGRMDGASGDK